jgi:hypothetical protein
MAPKAKIRGGIREKILRRLSRVDAVAADATNVCSAVGRAFVDHVVPRVALETAVIDGFGRGFCRIEDLCLISATVNVRLGRPVAVCAGTAVGHCWPCLNGMGIVCEVSDQSLMTSDARRILIRFVQARNCTLPSSGRIVLGCVCGRWKFERAKKGSCQKCKNHCGSSVLIPIDLHQGFCKALVVNPAVGAAKTASGLTRPR